MDITKKIAEEISIEAWQVEAVVKLIDEGNTIPFIARYRKEQHGSLDDTQIRLLSERLNYLRGLEDRKATVCSSIEEQGKLTPELEKAIEKAETLVALEDIYRPYKQKRRTRATVAKEKGLEPLAGLILAQETDRPVEEDAAAYVSEEKGVADVKEAISGACDIIAEQISDNADYRTGIRNFTRKTGLIVSKAKDPEIKSVYEMYYDFQEPVAKITGYRVLAINRGEKEKILNVSLEVDTRQIILFIGHNVIKRDNKYTMPLLIAAMEDSYKRLIAPAIEREIRGELTEAAEDGAIKVFDQNLTQLLMQPPIAGQVVLGWDPGYNHGCKLAVVDETGKVLDTAIIYPTEKYPGAGVKPRDMQNAVNTVKKLIEKYHVTLISLGNGTASRESEQVIVDLIKDIPQKVQYVITNEAGASVYSASKLAAEEFPDFDVEQRGAASMARRVQDPLAELVKIDPKAIGVGQYQHDMNQKKLDEALTGVVEDCVNRVGVDLNTASAPLMEHISGINKTIAKNIVAFREENGRFESRKQLLKVPKLGPKAFEQCAGFMRIAGGKEPLDNTGVHPESYAAADELIRELGLDKETVFASVAVTGEGSGTKTSGKAKVKVKDYAAFAEKLGIGEPTLRDIVKELNAPGRDPREDMPKPVLRSDVLSMEDLKEGMILKGTVRNVIDFGAFVDIGVHQDGLVHISEMSDRKFVKHPLDVVSVGDIVKVKVISVDLSKKRIGLSMKGIE
ncbi:MAG: RNA-binding transcriptional accessory protein [Eubacterium sp.]|nr:RNA-binding transcriptional accessory protein [Eubacterium sp.]